jgi:phosphatidylethanolamine/phosphatidyl-N-methylethanolamine N-methyltransferase
LINELQRKDAKTRGRNEGPSIIASLRLGVFALQLDMTEVSLVLSVLGKTLSFRELGVAMRFLAESRAFLRQFRTQSFTTGSVLPSSRALGRALVRHVCAGSPPRKVLEVGPGTGAVTRVLVDALRPGDELDIVEINGAFADLIRQRFAEEPAFARVKEQTRIMHRPLQDVPGEAVYDFMISGVPLNNFPVALVDEIFASYRRLLKPGGVLSYFEYAGIRGVKKKVVGAAERKRLADLDVYLQEKIRDHQIAADFVLLNVPPAYARHLRFEK